MWHVVMLRTHGTHWYMTGYTRLDSFVYVYNKNGILRNIWRMSGLDINCIAYELHELHNIRLTCDGLRYLLRMIHGQVPETFRVACVARYAALIKEYEEIGSIVARVVARQN